jgi:3'-5' exoribonuclease
MKTIFIESITADTGTVTDFFQVAQADKKTKKNGEPYLSMVLRDRTGEVDAKLWSIPDGLELSAGDFVKVEAQTDTYRDAMQLKVTRIRKLDRAEVTLDDYLPASQRDRDAMHVELLIMVDHIGDDNLRTAVMETVLEVKDLLRDAPAAKKNHQPYLGGLLEHTLTLCALVSAICLHYKDLDADVLLAGAILHDIGKVFELCYEDHIGITAAGRLVGHVIQGSILWAQHSAELDPATRDHVSHIIASHHGQKEWGAAQVPMTREAFVLHLLDNMDSKLGIIDGGLASGVDADGFTSYNQALGSAIWKPRTEGAV